MLKGFRKLNKKGIKIMAAKAKELIVTLNKDKSADLKEYQKLNKEKKELEDKLSMLKGRLNLSTGKYQTDDGTTKLTISSIDNWTEVSPKDLLEALKKRKLSSKFGECVKVIVETSMKILGEEDFNKLRQPNGSYQRWLVK